LQLGRSEEEELTVPQAVAPAVSPLLFGRIDAKAPRAC